MKKIILSALGVIFIWVAGYAQDGYIVEPSPRGGAYILYTIQKGDNLTNIAKKSAINLQALLNANPKYSRTTIIYPNNQILIPLTPEDILSADKDISDDYIPLYYQIKPKEGLYRISLKFNRVPIPTLVKWNSIDSEDLIIKGRYLVIGYLKGDGINSGGIIHNKSFTSSITKSNAPENTVSTAAKARVDRTKTTKTIRTTEPVDEYTMSNKTSTITTTTTTPPKRIEKNNTTTVITSTTSTTTTTENMTNSTNNNADSKLASINNNAPQAPTTVVVQQKNADSVSNILASNLVDEEGFFKPLFLARAKENQQLQTGDLMCTTFENESGRVDKRYYALMTGVPVGQVIKIIAPATNRSVYVKILGPLNEELKRKKIDICISSPAAEQLQIKGESFIVKCVY